MANIDNNAQSCLGLLDISTSLGPISSAGSILSHREVFQFVKVRPILTAMELREGFNTCHSTTALVAAAHVSHVIYLEDR